MRFLYQVYGLTIASNEELPGLLQASDTERPPDIEVILGRLPPELGVGDELLPKPYHTEPGDSATDPSRLIARRLDGGRYHHLVYDGGIAFAIDRTGSRVWSQ